MPWSCIPQLWLCVFCTTYKFKKEMLVYQNHHRTTHSQEVKMMKERKYVVYPIGNLYSDNSGETADISTTIL